MSPLHIADQPADDEAKSLVTGLLPLSPALSPAEVEADRRAGPAEALALSRERKARDLVVHRLDRLAISSSRSSCWPRSGAGCEGLSTSTGEDASLALPPKDLPWHPSSALRGRWRSLALQRSTVRVLIDKHQPVGRMPCPHCSSVRMSRL